MACTSATLKGLPEDCQASMGGIKKLWILPYVEGNFTLNTSDSGNTVSSITSSGDTKAFYFKKGNAQATSTLNVDAQNGVNYVSTEIQMTFTRQEASKRAEVNALTMGETSVIYLDANNHMWALGIENPVSATAGTAQTGAQKSDGNFYQITLTADESGFPVEIPEGNVKTAIMGVAYPTA